MSGSATKGHLGKTVFGHDENGGREPGISGGGKLQQVSRVRSGKCNADAKDKL